MDYCGSTSSFNFKFTQSILKFWRDTTLNMNSPSMRISIIVPYWPCLICMLMWLAASATTQVYANDVVEQTTMLDGAFVRSLFHSFRDFTFRWVHSTASRQPMSKHLQEPHHERFPCDLGVRSGQAPDSVHRLRPG